MDEAEWKALALAALGPECLTLIPTLVEMSRTHLPGNAWQWRAHSSILSVVGQRPKAATSLTRLVAAQVLEYDAYRDMYRPTERGIRLDAALAAERVATP